MHPLPRFLSLTLLLSLPLWVGASVLDTTRIIPVRLPLSALQFLAVLIAAIAVTRRGGGSVRALLRRGADVARIEDPRWRIAIVALMPLTVALSYLLSRGHAADAGGATPLAATPVFLLVYGVSAFCEQIGWTAVMTDRLLTRHRVVPAGLIVGATWAAWHIVPFIQTRNTATWIAWQCAYTIVYRVLLTEVYVRTNRSVFGTIAMHATYNTAFSLLPYYGSSYDPMSMTLATLGTTAAVFATRFARGSREHGTP